MGSRQEGPYMARIREMSSNGYPNLRNLSEFMKEDTYSFGTNPRASCTILNFQAEKQTPTILRASDPSYNNSISTLSSNRGKSKALIILEDLTSDFIEEIGGQLSIDPHFFASHLRTAEWKKGDKFINSARLPSAQKSDDFICLRYFDSIILEKEYGSTAALQDGTLQRNIEFRTPKSLKEDGKDRSVAMISRSMSFWVRRYENDCWEGMGSIIFLTCGEIAYMVVLAVLLTDPRLLSSFMMGMNTPTGLEMETVSSWKPFANGTIDFKPWPGNFKDHTWPVRDQKRTLLDELLHYWKQPWVYTSSISPLDQTNLLLQKIVQSKWMVTSTYLCEDFNSLELQNLSRDTPQIQIIGSILDELMSSRNLLVKCCLLVKRTLIELGIQPTEELYFSNRNDSIGRPKDIRDFGSQRTSLTVDAVQADWTFILRELQAWQEDTKELLDTHMMSLQFLDSNRALADSRSQHSESRNVNRLTFLGAVFVPLSFTASLLSMGDDYIPGSGPHFWVFWSVAMPLTVLILVAIFLAQSMDSPPKATRSLPSNASSERGIGPPQGSRGWSFRRRRGNPDVELLMQPQMVKTYELSHHPVSGHILLNISAGFCRNILT